MGIILILYIQQCNQYNHSVTWRHTDPYTHQCNQYNRSVYDFIKTVLFAGTQCCSNVEQSFKAHQT